MMTRIHRRIGLSTVAIAVTALALTGASSPAGAGKNKKEPAAQSQAASGSTLQDAGLRFESARLLSDADRPAGLEDALQITARAIQGGPEEERAAARFLSGEIRCGLGRYREAEDEFR